MIENKFVLKNREEVVIFDDLLSEYCKNKSQVAFPGSLINAYDYLKGRKDFNRIFNSYLDLRISFSLTLCDMVNSGQIWNRDFSLGKLEGGSILDSQEKFTGKMDMYRVGNSFISRYRAVWDKIMGFIILLWASDKYDDFCSSKSRKKSFKKIASSLKNIEKDTVDQIEEQLTKFDNKFRTAEMHGTGSLYKWTFLMESMHENPQIELVEYWNYLNQVMKSIDSILSSSLKSSSTD